MNDRESSVWITCRECGHTSRALAVMAKRVMSQRHSCPACHSQNAPMLEPTYSGANISLYRWRRAMSSWMQGFPDGDSEGQEEQNLWHGESWGHKAIRLLAAQMRRVATNLYKDR